MEKRLERIAFLRTVLKNVHDNLDQILGADKHQATLRNDEQLRSELARVRGLVHNYLQQDARV